MPGQQEGQNGFFASFLPLPFFCPVYFRGLALFVSFLYLFCARRLCLWRGNLPGLICPKNVLPNALHCQRSPAYRNPPLSIPTWSHHCTTAAFCYLLRRAGYLRRPIHEFQLQVHIFYERILAATTPEWWAKIATPDFSMARPGPPVDDDHSDGEHSDSEGEHSP